MTTTRTSTGTRRRPERRSAGLVLGAAACVVAAGVLAACGLPRDQAYRPVQGDDIPYGLQETTTSTVPTTVPIATTTTIAPTTTTTPRTDPVTVYFVLGSRLTTVVRQLDKPVSPTEVMIELQQGPQRGERPVGMRSSVQPDMIGEVEVVGGIADVDLAPTVLELRGSEQILAFAQIVGTLTERPGIGRVSFSIEGRPVDAPRGDGSLASGSVSRDDYNDLLPPLPGEPPATTSTTATPVDASATPPNTSAAPTSAPGPTAAG
jgi:hypothetical protein